MSLSNLSEQEKQLFSLLQMHQPCTKHDLVKLSGKSEKMIRIYISKLKNKHLVKELPTLSRLKQYAIIDFVPLINEDKPHQFYWGVFVPRANEKYSLGQIASHWATGWNPETIKAAWNQPYIIAWLTYLSTLKLEEMDNETFDQKLTQLRELIKDSIAELESAIKVFHQLLNDSRLWKREQLDYFPGSPEFPNSKQLAQIVERLTREASND